MARRLQNEFMSYLRLFLILSLSIIVLVGGAQYAFSYQMMEQMALDSSQSTLVLLVNTHEMILTQVEESVTSVLNNSLLLDYMDFFRKNMHNTCLSIIGQLNGAADGNGYVDSICVYYRDDDYTLSSDFGPAELKWYYDAEFLSTLDAMDWKANRVHRREIENTASRAGKKDVLTMVRTLPMFHTSRYPKAYVVVNLDVEAITKSLKLLSDRTDIVLSVQDEYGNRIADMGADEEVREYFRSIQISQGGLKVSREKVGGKEMLTQSMSAKRGWIYHFAQPVGEVMGGISRMQNNLLIVCALSLMLSVILSLLFSRRVFEPIRAISDRFAEVFGDDGANYGRETEHLIGRIDAMIARNAQLENERRALARQSRERRFLALARGYTDVEKRESEAEALGIRATKGREMALMTTDGAPLPHDIALELASVGFEVVFAAKDNGMSGVVLVDFDTGRDVMEAARALKRLENDLYVGASRPFSNADALCDAYAQARNDMRERGMYEAPGAPYPSNIESDLLRALKNRDLASARASLDAFGAYIADNRCSTRAAGVFYKRLFLVAKHLKAELAPVADISAPNGDPEDMRGAMAEIVKDMIESMHPLEHAPYSELVMGVCAYIDANLSENLSIEKLSERFFLSASNLRKTFRAETGITVKEYIDGRRLVAAKRMLREEDLQIQQIASQLGFRYAQSFIAFFRAMMGVTPGEYRARG